MAVCVCKYRPCEKLKRKEQECEDYKTLAKQHLADFFEKEQKCENLTNKNYMLETELNPMKLLNFLQYMDTLFLKSNGIS